MGCQQLKNNEYELTFGDREKKTVQGAIKTSEKINQLLYKIVQKGANRKCIVQRA